MNPIIKTDKIGDFYDPLPEGFKLATIDDFHKQGKLNIGMTFLVEWNDQVHFSIRNVDEDLTGKKINPLFGPIKILCLRTKCSPFISSLDNLNLQNQH